MKHFKIIIVSLCFLMLPSCQTSTLEKDVRISPTIELSGIDPSLLVEPTQVMVLGTAHLRQYKEHLTPNDLDALIERLATFKPDFITVENMPGELCELINMYPEEYPGVAENYCPDVNDLRLESGLTAPEAAKNIRNYFDARPAFPTPAQRRELTAAFLAAGDVYSALVQWLKLPIDAQIQRDGIGEASVTYLNTLKGDMGESTQVAVRLAIQLGHERIFHAEDHTVDKVIAHYGSDLWDRLQQIWSSGSQQAREQYGAIDTLFKEKKLSMPTVY